MSLPDGPLRVLLADGNPAILRYLRSVLERAEKFVVAGLARDADEALAMASSTSPQVILLNVDLPPLGGMETTRRILAEAPVPIVVYPSGQPPGNRESVDRAFAVLKEGAVAVVEGPVNPDGDDITFEDAKLLRTLANMAQVPVVTRRRDRRETVEVDPGLRSDADAGTKIVAIGASTGGPAALKTVFAMLPEDFPLPILVVQHIAPGFLDAMTRWLDAETALRVKIGEEGEALKPGTVYFAPDGHHMGITGGRRIHLEASPPIGGVRPSVSFLFGSVIVNFGRRSVGILLSGMGSDGSIALEELKRAGAVTVVQDEKSSVVFGMARKAIELDGAGHILSPTGIGTLLLKLAPAPDGGGGS